MRGMMQLSPRVVLIPLPLRIVPLALAAALLCAPAAAVSALAAGQQLPPPAPPAHMGNAPAQTPPAPMRTAAPYAPSLPTPAPYAPAAAPAQHTPTYSTSTGMPATAPRPEARPSTPPPVILTVKSKTATTDLDDTLMQSYRRQAHSYRAAGRMELARQQLEMALAACNTEEEKALVRQELSTVNAIIKLRR